MMKYLGVITIMLIALYPTEHFAEVHREAHQLTSKSWVLTKDDKKNNRKLSVFWYSDGKLKNIEFTSHGFTFWTAFNYEPKSIKVDQQCFYPGYEEVPPHAFGLHYELNEKLLPKRSLCFNEGFDTENMNEDRICGPEIHYDPSGKVTKTIQHPKCDNPCGRFQPYITPGEYVLKSNTIIRSGIGKDTKALTSKKAGEKVKVVRDTHKLELLYGNIMPWVEVEYEPGKKGYMYGGLLDFIAISPEGLDFDALMKIEFIGKVPQTCNDVAYPK